MSLTHRKNLPQTHTCSCELCTALVHRVTPGAGKRSFHRKQLLSTSLLLHLNPQHTANPHTAPAKQFQIMAGGTPTATQCKSDLCTAQMLSPSQDKQHGSQLTGTDQKPSKFTPIRYGTVTWEFILRRKLLNRKFKTNSDLNGNIFYSNSSHLLKARKIQIASNDSKQPSGNMLHGCPCQGEW